MRDSLYADDVDDLPLRQGVPILSGMMYKRAQGRSTFGRTNWKKRWFVLHSGMLSYWTLEGGQHNPNSECKGLVPLTSIHALERVGLEAFGKPHMIQIVHTSVLYVQCPSREDCDEWLHALRKQCSTNDILHAKYHPGFFDGGKWSCCSIASKDFKGCQKAFDYSIFFRRNRPYVMSPKDRKDCRDGTSSAKSSPRPSATRTSPKNSVVTQQKPPKDTKDTKDTKDRKASTQSKGDSHSAKSSRDFSYVPHVKPIKTSPLRQPLNPPSDARPDQQQQQQQQQHQQQPVVVRVTRVAYV